MLNFTSWQLSTSKYKIKQYMQLEPRIKTNKKKNISIKKPKTRAQNKLGPVLFVF